MPSIAVQSVILLVAALANLCYIAWHTQQAFKPVQEREYSYYAHDFPEILPLPSPVGTVQVVMEESVHYAPLGNQSEDAWASTTTTGGGYVRLGPTDRMFAVSMFHEMHCLRTINRAFSKTTGATPPHLQHCLNYIRQNILCSPDLTLEPGNFEERDFEVERIGGTHTCKDWGPIYEYMDANYYSFMERTGRPVTVPEHVHL
ncbi:hypothetical protein OH77DRAFT_1501557 [Trametes cingulata]|nr:hypothetical protein OH77DRAFT_1501557 [Trametes cingulata]